MDVLSPPHDPGLLAELGGISDAWLTRRAGREKRFSVGRFGSVWLGKCRIAVVRPGDRIVLEARGTNSATVDLMRHADNAPSGTMEFLFTALMLRLKEEGFGAFNLGMVPFAGLDDTGGTDLWSRFGALIYDRDGAFYSFAGLREFKDNFDPEWHPRYFCCRTVLPPVGPLADAARLISGTALGVMRK